MKETPIAIIGLGLIGGSLGLALGTADPKESPFGRARIIGYDANKQAMRTARGRLAIDEEAPSAAEAAGRAAIVIIATPVQAVREVMAEIAPHLRQGALVIDTASTKAQVMRWARELLPRTASFVGGHPMAGSEQSGIDAASIDLFKDAIYCLCPDPQARSEAVDTAQALVETIGAKPYYLDPEEHDAYVAGISHLPFLLSTALVEMTSRSPGWVEMQALAATGFRDVSRLASGDPTMHRDICLTNGPAITRWINDTIRFLVEVREAIAEQNTAALDDLFNHARQVREAWLQRTPHQRPGEPGPTPGREDLGPTIGQLFMGRMASRRRREEK